MARKKPKVNIIIDNDEVKPAYANDAAAGLDIFSNETIRVPGRGVKAIETGIRMEIEEGYYATIEERSGMSLRTPLSLKAGIIDSDYRGEIKVVFQNVSDIFYDIRKGEKIAQLIFHRQETPKIEYVSEFENPDTERGEKGFGSTDTTTTTT